MRRLHSVLCALLLAGIPLAPAAAAAEDDASAVPLRSSIGIQGGFLTGVHSDIAGDQHGLAVVPLIELTAVPLPRVAIHLEGLPVISVPQNASAAYGQATPAVGLFDGAVRFAIDPQRRFWIGGGTVIINQRTPLPAQGQVVSSRLSGGRYEFYARSPLGGGRFIDALVGTAPRLWGTDHYISSIGAPPLDRDERAFELDISLAMGWRHPNSEFLAGLRTINFAAMFTATGEAADRNNGVGVFVEARRYIGGR